MGKKSSPKAPKAPDPYKAADAQSKANLEAIRASADVNRYNEVGPTGSVTWEAPADGGDGGWTRSTNLSPEAQAQFDQQNQLAATLGGQALNRAGQIDTGKFSTDGLPSVSRFNTSNLPEMKSGLDYGGLQGVDVPDKDYSQDASRVEQATYDRAMGLMQPEFDQQGRRLETSLSTKGLPIGSEAYNNEMTRFDTNKNEAMTRAALDSVSAGRDEQSRLAGLDAAKFGMQSSLRGQQSGEQLADANLAATARGQGVNEQINNIGFESRARDRAMNEALTERTQPMNELAAILQGSPAMQAPTSAQPAQYQVAPADIQGAISQNYQGELNNYNQAIGSQNAKKGGTTQMASTAAMKYFMACIPQGQLIDTPDGRQAIDEIKAGDFVIGYNGTPVKVLIKHEYMENPDADRFAEIAVNGELIRLCDKHRIEGVRSEDLSIGDIVGGKTIESIEWFGGVTTSYDILTDDAGYQIGGVPVNSMIEEMNRMARNL